LQHGCKAYHVVMLMWGIIAIATASLLWSFNPAVISRYGRAIKPLTFTGIRASIALIPLLPLLFSRNTSLELDLLAWIVIALSAIIGPGIGDSLYALSIKTIGGSLAVTISYTYIFFTQIFSRILANEIVGLKTVAGAFIAFMGIAISVSGKEHSKVVGVKEMSIGFLAGLGTAVAWGLGTVLVKISLRYIPDVVVLTAVRLIIIALSLLLVGYGVEGWYSKELVGDVMKAATITGVLGWTIGMYLYIYAISVMGASLAAIATALTPVISQITTKTISHEKISMRNIAGSIAVTLGVAITYL